MKLIGIGAYAANNRTGWAAYNNEGITWPVDEDTANRLEAERDARNRNKHRLAAK